MKPDLKFLSYPIQAVASRHVFLRPFHSMTGKSLHCNLLESLQNSSHPHHHHMHPLVGLQFISILFMSTKFISHPNVRISLKNHPNWACIFLKFFFSFHDGGLLSTPPKYPMKMSCFSVHHIFKAFFFSVIQCHVLGLGI